MVPVAHTPTRNGALIAETLADFARWAEDEPRAPRLRRRLHGGMSNEVWLLEGECRSYVLRIAGGELPPGVDRRRECLLHHGASRRALAPRLYHCDALRGLLVTAWVDAPGTRATAAELAGLLRRIHALPATGAPLHSPRQLERLQALLPQKSRGARMLREHAAVLGQAGATLDASHAPVVTCHNDLLAHNRRRDGRRLLALDWEYACCGDPFYDLAVCASERGEGAATALLETYLGRPADTGEARRFAAQRLTYAAIALAWHARYTPDSPAIDTAGEQLRHLAATAGAAAC
jgi:thiamine kinase